MGPRGSAGPTHNGRDGLPPVRHFSSRRRHRPAGQMRPRGSAGPTHAGRDGLPPVRDFSPPFRATSADVSATSYHTPSSLSACGLPARGTACRVGLEAPERTGQRHYPTFQTGSGREPCRQIRVARPTWPFSAATCRRVSAPPAHLPKVAFPAHPERRTGRPPQRAGRAIHPDLYCIVAGKTLFEKAGLLSRTGFQPVCLRASSPRHSLSDWAGSPRKERPEALSYFSDRF